MAPHWRAATGSISISCKDTVVQVCISAMQNTASDCSGQRGMGMIVPSCGQRLLSRFEGVQTGLNRVRTILLVSSSI